MKNLWDYDENLKVILKAIMMKIKKQKGQKSVS